MATTDRMDADRLYEECGVFGVYGHPEAAALVALGLHALQHRGQEAGGIVAYDGEQFSAHRGMGQVSDNFSSKEVIGRLRGRSAVGHVRYATTGEVALRNVLSISCLSETVAVLRVVDATKPEVDVRQPPRSRSSRVTGVDRFARRPHGCTGVPAISRTKRKQAPHSSARKRGCPHMPPCSGCMGD